MLMDDPLAFLRHPSEAWLRGQLRRNCAEAFRLWWARRGFFGERVKWLFARQIRGLDRSFVISSTAKFLNWV